MSQNTHMEGQDMQESSLKKAGNFSGLDFLQSSLENMRLALHGCSVEDFVLRTIEALMELDRRDYLASLRLSGCRDKGNGSYERAFHNLSRNSMTIKIPRTRYTSFKPYALEFLKYQQDQINALVLSLYSKGLTTRDVSSLLEDFFGENISAAQVSNLAEQFNELRLAWESSALERYYKVIYADAIYITVRRGDSYAKEPVHVIYGVREDDLRELLDLSINPTESSGSWSESLARLKQRGVEEIALVVADGLPGLEDEVHRHFPGALFQKCVVHKMRNVLTSVRTKDKAEVSEDLRHVFDNFDNDATTENAMHKLANFIDKWKLSYPGIHRKFANETCEYYFTYINLPVQVRRLVYTTNSIENLNKKIRKATKNKQSFEKTERLLDYLFVIIKEFEAKNWMKYPVANFKFLQQRTQSV